LVVTTNIKSFEEYSDEFRVQLTKKFNREQLLSSYETLKTEFPDFTTAIDSNYYTNYLFKLNHYFNCYIFILAHMRFYVGNNKELHVEWKRKFLDNRRSERNRRIKKEEKN